MERIKSLSSIDEDFRRIKSTKLFDTMDEIEQQADPSRVANNIADIVCFVVFYFTDCEMIKIHVFSLISWGSIRGFF